MRPPTPFMKAVLYRVAHNIRYGARDATHKWNYPAQQLNGLERRGLIAREGDFVALTAAGRALLPPPTLRLDDLPVLDEESAPWPIDVEL